MKLLKFPDAGIKDVAKGLRILADKIDSGEYGDAHNLAWVLDCGSSRVEFGLLGQTASAGAEFNLLLDTAKNRLVKSL